MSGDRVEKLPLVLLRLREYIIPEFNITAAEVIYGETIHLPPDFISDNDTPSDDSSNVPCFVGKLAIKPLTSPHHDTRKTFVHPTLESCTHVSIRNYATKKSDKPTYNSLFEVRKRSGKVCVVQTSNGQHGDSISRLRPPFLLHDNAQHLNHLINQQLIPSLLFRKNHALQVDVKCSSENRNSVVIGRGVCGNTTQLSYYILSLRAALQTCQFIL